ncbi:MAG: FtsW/RodA/SpoVE family cell cycle protein [Lachnospiraceae bacterium]
MAQNTRQKKKKIKRLALLERSDFQIYLSLMMLVIFGLLMVFSASAFSCANDKAYDYDMFALVKKQAIFAVMGFGAILVMRLIDYHLFGIISGFLYIVGLLLILALKTPLGITVNNATRWLPFPGGRFQVAEVVKIALILWLAFLIQYYYAYLHQKRVLFLLWASGVFPAVLLWRISNDLSSALVLLGITFGMTFLFCDFNKIHAVILGVLAVCVPCVYWYYANNLPTAEALAQKSFRIGRIVSWVNPERYASSQGYQTLQALYAIGSGGLGGKGIGNGMQKLSKIPEAQNDMVFSVVCEELGLVGAALLLFLFGYLTWQLIKVAFSCKDPFGSALVIGIALQISLQVLINVGVCLNVIPNTGISLPFISYGGTSLLLLLAEMGLVFSVFRQMEIGATRRHLQKQKAMNERQQRVRAKQRRRPV